MYFAGAKEFIKQQNIVNKELNDHLKQVYVTSTGTEVGFFVKICCKQWVQYFFAFQPVFGNNNRPLPVDRELNTIYDDVDLPEEEKDAPPGKLSIRQALELIAKFRTDSELYSIEALTEDYKLTDANTRK